MTFPAKSPVLTHPLSSVAALVAVCAACTPYGYTKPEMTEQGLATDQTECAEIAREHAFLDNSRDRLRAETVYTGRRRDTDLYLYGTLPSLPELQTRYHRICMQARGYQLAPLEEEGGSPAEEDN
jgi:hypothetical protein